MLRQHKLPSQRVEHEGRVWAYHGPMGVPSGKCPRVSGVLPSGMAAEAARQKLRLSTRASGRSMDMTFMGKNRREMWNGNDACRPPSGPRAAHDGACLPHRCPDARVLL
jgi:hypothetical protein